jgi:ATP-dependent RNA helicase RhlE
MAFKKLEIIEPILKAVAAEGYTIPTPIQQQAIPLVLQRKDLLGCAQTGTGKTAAFAIPILQILHEQKPLAPGIKVLILTPTRELAIQIDESFAAYGKFTGIRHTVIFGGVSQLNQTNALRRGVDVLVATPGRLLDLMTQGYVRLDKLQIFVLDEADRMLDMGFIHDVKRIIAKLPAKRQTLFFSATMPPEIQKLANVLLTHPVKVEVTPPATTVDKTEQSLYHVGKMEKPELLLHLLHDKAIVTALVFTRTKHGADKVVKILQRHNIRAAAIHGNKSQNARQDALANFKNGGLRVLVATDIAARGIDIDDLTHVINFEMPNIPETYVHRIGRTGRAGNTGIAISFCSREEKDELRDIQKLIGKTIPVIHEHPFLVGATAVAQSPVVRPQQQLSFKPRHNNFQTQSSGSGNHVRRGYGAQRKGIR